MRRPRQQELPCSTLAEAIHLTCNSIYIDLCDDPYPKRLHTDSVGFGYLIESRRELDGLSQLTGLKVGTIWYGASWKSLRVGAQGHVPVLATQVLLLDVLWQGFKARISCS